LIAERKKAKAENPKKDPITAPAFDRKKALEKP
jgi:hypothetical protein